MKNAIGWMLWPALKRKTCVNTNNQTYLPNIVNTLNNCFIIIEKKQGNSSSEVISQESVGNMIKIIINQCYYISLFLCKPFNNCLYSPIGVCEPENRIIQPKNS